VNEHSAKEHFLIGSFLLPRFVGYVD